MSVSKVPNDPSLSKEVRSFLDDLWKQISRVAIPQFASSEQALEGTSEDVTMSPARTVEVVKAFDAFSNKLLHVQDQKPNNTTAGTFFADTWLTRDLNTVLTNEIDGAALSTNRITLPEGRYWIEAQAPGYQCADHVAKLRSITSAGDILIGTGDISGSSMSVQSFSFISGRFSLSGTTVLEIQHRCNSSGSFGRQHNLGTIQIFTDVKIWRLD